MMDSLLHTSDIPNILSPVIVLSTDVFVLFPNYKKQ